MYGHILTSHKLTTDEFYDDENLFPILDPVVNPSVPVDVRALINRVGEGNHLVFTNGGMIKDSTYHVTFLVTEFNAVAFNSEYIAIFPITDDPLTSYSIFEQNEESSRLVFELIGGGYFKLNQFDYCNLMLEKFFIKVFGKSPSEMFCAGVVSAHGDKFYGYDVGNIPKERALLLYLAGRSKDLHNQTSIPNRREVQITPDHEHNIGLWVMDNYHAFEPIFEECEASLKIHEKS